MKECVKQVLAGVSDVRAHCHQLFAVISRHLGEGERACNWTRWCGGSAERV